jgi:hypothetical protein
MVVVELDLPIRRRSADPRPYIRRPEGEHQRLVDGRRGDPPGQKRNAPASAVALIG